ncbi:MAG: hypothetical protein EPO22_05265 [Dehalococcoidia bacterium]|nr:MAG: hypothetical protein EPO22_05265 [Dehalococcoidia bacterium]
MGGFTPADEAIRARIRDDVGVNMCVEAGAGTGKTTVLVDRIVRIVASGHAEMPNIAVITFTEKAAAELSARVRQGLHAAMATATDDAERRRIAEALRTLSQAHIETIHAFAAGILRERPIEAGLDPGFEVLADLPAQLDFEEAYNEWLTAEMARIPPPAALAEALNVGLDFTLVRSAAEKLHLYRDLLPLPAYPSQQADLAGTLDAIMSELDGVRALAPKEGVHDDAYDAMLDACRQFDAIAAIEGDAALLNRTMAAVKVSTGSRGNKEHWNPASDCTSVKDALRRINKLHTSCKERLRGAATANLLHWLEGFVRQYADRRKRDGNADFEDLLLLARNLLRDMPEVRRYFQGKYRCVLVDEFQDTDPLQVELVIYLCADGDVADWRRAKLRPGSLFVVGDPKQSIYRFRRADIAMYDAFRGSLFGGEPLEISQNFRSVIPIIDWVNDVFGQLIQKREGMQPAYIDLEPMRHVLPPDEESVTLLRGSVPKTSSMAHETRRVEAAALASLIAREVERGAWHVREDDGTRRATYRDVVILIPRRTELELYEEALASAGVPYRHEGGRSFYLRQEVRELVAVLRAVDDPSDAVAAVAALRSSAFGCSDEDLLLYRDGGGRFDHLSVPASATGPVADSLRTLRRFAEMRHETPLPEIVRHVLDETRLVEFALLQPQGDQVAANLLKVIDQARAFGEARGGGLRAFVRWLRENIARSADETDASTSEETDDVVRIMTIWAAKGLEFPIVVFANMNTDRLDYTTVVADRTGQGHLHVQLGKKELAFRTPGFDDAAAAEQEHSSAEEARLLYVASTRARDRLVVPFFAPEGGSKKDKPSPSLNDRLRSAGADEGDAVEAASLPQLQLEAPVWQRLPDFAPQPEVDRVIAAREQWKNEHQSGVDAVNTKLRYATASALKPEWERPALADDGVRRGRAAELGSAVHALLERIELARPDDATSLAPIIASEFGLAGQEGEIERLARRALASEVIQRALDPRTVRVLREVAFTVALPDAPGTPAGVAEGRIDLLFERGGEMTVVDFKTDRVAGPAQIEERTATYRNQALVYAWATRLATGRPVREVVFVYAHPGVERPIAVDAAFMAEAETLMRQAALPFDD